MPTEVSAPDIALESYHGQTQNNNLTPKLLFRTLEEKIKIPKQASKGSAGYNIYASKSIIIKPKSQALISTSLACEIPTNYYGQLMS